MAVSRKDAGTDGKVVISDSASQSSRTKFHTVYRLAFSNPTGLPAGRLGREWMQDMHIH